MLVTVGFVLLLSILLSIIVGNVSTRQLKVATYRSLEELAFQMADKLDRGMFERYRDLQNLASLDTLHQPSPSLSNQRDLLEQLQSTYPSYAWIGITDTQGNVLSSTGGLLEGKSAAKRPWFQAGKSHPFVGDVHEALLLAKLLPNNSKEPLRFVDIATPIIDTNGQFKGVLSAHLSWSWAREVAETLLLPEQEQRQVDIFIVSQSGTILLGPPEWQGTALPSVLQAKLRTSTSGHFLGKGLGYTVSQTERLGQGLKPESFISESVVSGFSQTQGYRNYPGLGWSVWVQQPATLALYPARLLQVQVLAWCLGLGSVFAGLSWWITRRVSRSMHQLTDATQRIREGETDVVIPQIRGQDEITGLSKSLCHMVETLRLQQQELLSTNQQLQRELLDRQQAERKVREQAELLNIATDAIFVRDLDNRIKFWNQSAQHIYGWTSEEACGQDSMQLLNPDHSSELDIAYRTVLQQGEWRGELMKVTKAGKQITTESRWALASDMEGCPQFILTVDTDITEQKQLEAHFLRVKRLESLGMLASGIAHDLNNIFTPILGVAKLLSRAPNSIDDQSKKLIEILDGSARRGSDLVKQIVMFSRGGEGKLAPIQVSHLLIEIQKIIRSILPSSIELSMDMLNEELPLIYGNETQLHQVLMNLCVNAKDAMPNGGELMISAKPQIVDRELVVSYPQARAGEYLVIAIADTGIGMSSEIQEHILEPFFTTKEVGRGTGLGLSTVYGLIKKHGGFLQIESQENQGSTFRVFLPIN